MLYNIFILENNGNTTRICGKLHNQTRPALLVVFCSHCFQERKYYKYRSTNRFLQMNSLKHKIVLYLTIILGHHIILVLTRAVVRLHLSVVHHLLLVVLRLELEFNSKLKYYFSWNIEIVSLSNSHKICVSSIYWQCRWHNLSSSHHGRSKLMFHQAHIVWCVRRTERWRISWRAALCTAYTS